MHGTSLFRCVHEHLRDDPAVTRSNHTWNQDHCCNDHENNFKKYVGRFSDLAQQHGPVDGNEDPLHEPTATDLAISPTPQIPRRQIRGKLARPRRPRKTTQSREKRHHHPWAKVERIEAMHPSQRVTVPYILTCPRQQTIHSPVHQDEFKSTILSPIDSEDEPVSSAHHQISARTQDGRSKSGTVARGSPFRKTCSSAGGTCHTRRRARAREVQ